MKVISSFFLILSFFLVSCSFAETSSSDPFSSNKDPIDIYRSGVDPTGVIQQEILVLDAAAFGLLETGTELFNQFYQLKLMEFLNTKTGFGLDVGERIAVFSERANDFVKVTIDAEKADVEDIVKLLEEEYAGLYYPQDVRYKMWRVYSDSLEVASDKFVQRLEWYLKNDPDKWNIDGWTEAEKSVMRDELLKKWTAPWQAFSSQYREGDEVWYFITPRNLWEMGLGNDGYVLFRKGKVLDVIFH